MLFLHFFFLKDNLEDQSEEESSGKYIDYNFKIYIFSLFLYDENNNNCTIG